MNSEEEFFDAETGEMIRSSLCIHGLLYRFIEWIKSVPGLESDDSCEVSFKDALLFDSKQGTDGRSAQENGLWERRLENICLYKYHILYFIIRFK